jgi:SAM-dependent methyltransferase
MYVKDLKVNYMNEKPKTAKCNLTNKPQYGVYAGYSVIAAFFILAAIGMFSVLFGLYAGVPLASIIGAVIGVIFLWPAVGILASIKTAQNNTPDYSFLLNYVRPKILDCGCGLGRRAIQLAKQMPEGGFLTGIDIFDKKSISINSLERARENVETEGVSDRVKIMKGSVTEIPFGEEEFDLVTCISVLHEMRSPESRRRAFHEVYRVLKPGGRFYVSELGRQNMVKYMGLFGLMFKNKGFWEQQLAKNHFKILNCQNSNNGVEIFSEKK